MKKKVLISLDKEVDLETRKNLKNTGGKISTLVNELLKNFNSNYKNEN